ncbi:MAG: hypothetical protein ACFFE2_06030 [Candidatus Thorarchaeota archaeon]
MTDENTRDRIFRAVKERIKETDEQDRIQMITNAIGDRRYRDLVDIVARIEGESDWPTALEYLMKAQDKKYSSPMTIGQDKTSLEALKYREMIFELLSCRGLEPVPISMTNLLTSLKNEPSLVAASRVLLTKLEEMTIKQIEAGDTLFFDFSENVSISQEVVNLLDQTRKENIQNISINQNGNLFNVAPLWHSEYGRLAMSNLGIKGNIVDSDTFDSVLSVLQVSSIIKTRTVNVPLPRNMNEDSWTRPTNQSYRKLHSHLIHHEVNDLKLSASRHSIPLLNALLNEALSTYDNESSTNKYRNILDYINAHISVRDIESLLALEKASRMKNVRIATAAILAIGNFYNESSVATLLNLFCAGRDDAIIQSTSKAIENVYKKCPEADHAISISVDSECRNRGTLKKLYRRLSKEKPVYYR